MSVTIQFKRGTAAAWTLANPTLAEGEPGIETDTLNYKIGDGVTAWNSLAYKEVSPTFLVSTYNESTTDPSTPPSGQAYFYAHGIASRMMMKFKGPSGLDSALQPLLARNKVGIWMPSGNATTVPGVMGFTAYTATGTATARNIAVTNLFTRMRRLGYVSASTTGALCGARVAVAQITLGTGASNLGGFFKVIRFGISDAALVSGARMFVGVSSSTGAASNVEPSTLTNCIGVGHGASDANFKIYYGGSAAQTPIDLGNSFPVTNNTDVYELALFAPPSSDNTVYYEVTNLSSGISSEGTLTGAAGTVLPANTTLLTYSQNWRTNNATAAAVGLDIMSDYIETDY